MLINKYIVPLADGFVEFSNENSAIEYCTSNSISSDSITNQSIEYSDLTQVGETIVKTYIPQQVTPRQLKQALILYGLTLENIEAALNSLSEPTKSLAKIEWEYSLSFERNRPLVIQVGAMLGWTSGQLDALWIFASKL